MKIPTPIADSLHMYNNNKEGYKGSQKYKALESTCHVLIKYLSITFLLIAKDRNPIVFANASRYITDSSSLGGWVDAMDCVIRELKFSDETDIAREYLNFFNLHKTHPLRNKLVEFAETLNRLVTVLNNKGYRFGSFKNLSILRIFSIIVEVRNKVAHGNIPINTYEVISGEFENLIRELVYFIPLDEFSMYGQHNNASLSLEGIAPKLNDEPSKAFFWVESNLLESDFVKDIPFMQFDYETQEVFFLNDIVSDKSNDSEFISYTSGLVRHWKVSKPALAENEFVEIPRKHTVKINPDDYNIIDKIGKSWKSVPLASNSLELLAKKGKMIYAFCVKPKIAGVESFDMLYVGQSTEPVNRFKHYLQIYNKYDLTRAEITAMFEKYENRVSFYYIMIDSKVNLSKVESAFYNIFNPPYNIVAPPKTK